MMGELSSRPDSTGAIKRCRKMEILPHDLAIEILYWLPVKTLVRFQCVCKSWRELIMTRSFAVDHYRRNSLRNHMILASPDTDNPDYDSGSDDDDSPEHGFYLMNHIGHDGGTRLKVPWNWYSEESFICNGLVCILNEWIDEFTVCNPMINEFSVLPVRPKIQSPPSTLGIGFGIVPSTHHFIVVRVAAVRNSRNRTKFPFTVDVYVQGTGAWRSNIMHDLPPVKHFLYLGKGVYANGGIHWLASYEPNCEITMHRLLSFDVADEVLYWTSLPEVPEVPQERCAWYHLRQKESIACISCHESFYNVWTWIGDRSNGYWTKEYAFKLSFDICLRPILIRGSYMLFEDWESKNLVLVYLPSGAAGNLIHFDKPLPFIYSIFNESLLSVKS